MSLIREFELLDPDDDTRKQKFDNLFQTAYSIDVGHHEIHEGDSFVTDAVDTSMADTDTIILAFKTPSGTKWAHMVFIFETLVGAHVEIVEGPSWTDSTGSQNAIYNRERNSSTDSVLLEDTGGSFVATGNVVLNPTGFAGGTTIYTDYAFGIKNFSTGSGREFNEWVLAADQTYGIVATADGNSNKIHLILDWYEHSNS